MVVFPLSQTEEFFHYVADNLVHFALDKNAMCVIKHMMYKLREELNYKGAFILRDKFIARIG